MTDYGIAWLSANGRELGPIGGTVGCVEVLREARFGLDYVYPTADRVVFEGVQTFYPWPGNYEKLASRGCPSVWLKTTFAKPYSPRSEGYSPAPTRSRDLIQWWIQAQ